METICQGSLNRLFNWDIGEASTKLNHKIELLNGKVLQNL